MKNIKGMLILFFLMVSCQYTAQEITEPVALNPEYKSIALEIEGMTCEIGCAKLIESKISKMEGIHYSKVNFEANKGYFTYDANTLDKEAVANKISAIAGGGLYLVSKTEELKEVILSNQK